MIEPPIASQPACGPICVGNSFGSVRKTPDGRLRASLLFCEMRIDRERDLSSFASHIPPSRRRQRHSRIVPRSAAPRRANKQSNSAAMEAIKTVATSTRTRISCRLNQINARSAFESVVRTKAYQIFIRRIRSTNTPIRPTVAKQMQYVPRIIINPKSRERALKADSGIMIWRTCEMHFLILVSS